MTNASGAMPRFSDSLKGKDRGAPVPHNKQKEPDDSVATRGGAVWLISQLDPQPNFPNARSQLGTNGENVCASVSTGQGKSDACIPWVNTKKGVK